MKPVIVTEREYPDGKKVGKRLIDLDKFTSIELETTRNYIVVYRVHLGSDFVDVNYDDACRILQALGLDTKYIVK